MVWTLIHSWLLPIICLFENSVLLVQIYQILCHKWNICIMEFFSLRLIEIPMYLLTVYFYFIHLIAHRKISLILKCIEWNQKSTYISEHGSLTRCTRTTLSRLFCLGKTRIYQGQKSYNSDKSYQYQSSSPPSRSLPQVSPYQENRSAKQHGEHLNFGSKHGWINQLMGIWIRILGVETRVPARQDSRWES